MFVSCVQRRVEEGSVVGNTGCVAHVDVYGELVSYIVGGCNVYIEHARYRLSCLYAETVKCMSSGGSVWYVGF